MRMLTFVKHLGPTFSDTLKQILSSFNPMFHWYDSIRLIFSWRDCRRAHVGSKKFFSFYQRNRRELEPDIAISRYRSSGRLTMLRRVARMRIQRSPHTNSRRKSSDICLFYGGCTSSFGITRFYLYYVKD